MDEVRKTRELRQVLSPERIAARVGELGRQIDAAYGQEPLVMICILKGAFVFFSDLVRCLHNENLELDFVRLSSYGSGEVSSGHVVFSKDVETDLSGKHVLVVDDILDSGRSMDFMLKTLSVRRMRSLRLAVLLDKAERREVDVMADFVGFSWDGAFLVGYGLDYAEHYRMLPGIYELPPR